MTLPTNHHDHDDEVSMEVGVGGPMCLPVFSNRQVQIIIVAMPCLCTHIQLAYGLLKGQACAT